jgi:hypothetical protein
LLRYGFGCRYQQRGAEDQSQRLAQMPHDFSPHFLGLGRRRWRCGRGSNGRRGGWRIVNDEAISFHAGVVDILLPDSRPDSIPDDGSTDHSAYKLRAAGSRDKTRLCRGAQGDQFALPGNHAEITGCSWPWHPIVLNASGEADNQSGSYEPVWRM